jgi:ketosteroid isomerase-like protein
MLGDRDYRLDSVESRGDRAVAAFSWSSTDGQRHRWAQALRLKDGKIIDIQDYANPRSAAALMRLRTAFG